MIDISRESEINLINILITPGVGNLPVIGNLFKGKTSSDNLDELLVFIAPRIL